MTDKLYYDSAYISMWETTIQEVLEREDGIYVALEQTAFYPHGGGQPCDRGEISGIAVLDVVSEEGKVLHKLESLPQERQGSCRLDWETRFDHMQQHSGQHLLSAVCLKLAGAVTASFHLGNEDCTIDVERVELSETLLASIEQEVNLEIYRNHRIVSHWVSAQEAAKLPLVKAPTVTEEIRIVEIQEVEYNACGGTHVAATGEIGIIKLLRTEKIKGKTRIYFKCGTRALNEFNEQMKILAALSVRFNTGKEEIMDRIQKADQEQKLLQSQLNAAKEQLDSYLAQELLAQEDGGLISYIFADKPLKDLQSLATKLTAQTDAAVLLATTMESKLVYAHSGSGELSCGAFFKTHLAGFNGKGGGSAVMAQAGFPSWDEALSFYEFTRAQAR
ncbi:alanyl-tRNA editing protein [Paenibacillus donghaensis]|uniref:Hydrolase n=1 Tax=Paenibacillus donghaensis TaxID=414771 RepID=A0A2Z2KJW0_9BACL|nr:DHHA1 domain-containing protein [Paenibacillus donghaensis]ASA26297.1 hydrolase [Paenibacillus donghaensis]